MHRHVVVVSWLVACSAPRPVVQSHAPTPSATTAVSVLASSTSAPAAVPGELPTYAGRSPIVVEQPGRLRLANTACNEHVSVVLGRPVRAFGETLRDGDVLVVRGKGDFEIVDPPTTPITMQALRIVSAAVAVPCDERAQLTKRIIRGPEAAEDERRRRLATSSGRTVPGEGMERLLFEDDAVRVTHMMSNPMGFLEPAHERQWQAWVFLAGHGTFSVAGERFLLPKYEQPTLVIPPGATLEHRLDPSEEPYVQAWEVIRFVSAR